MSEPVFGERTTAEERANPKESTTVAERAKWAERTKSVERARTCQSTMKVERAKRKESTTIDERTWFDRLLVDRVIKANRRKYKLQQLARALHEQTNQD